MSDGEWRIPEAECFVYRIYNRRGGLVYVGITNDLMTRIGDHRKRSLWWPVGATVRWSEHDSRAAARREEVRLIRRHRPPNNIESNAGWHVVLTLDESYHEPGCRERYVSPGDRLAG